MELKNHNTKQAEKDYRDYDEIDKNNLEDIFKFLEAIEWMDCGYGEGEFASCRIWDGGDYDLLYDEERKTWTICRDTTYDMTLSDNYEDEEDEDEEEDPLDWITFDTFDELRNYCDSVGRQDLFREPGSNYPPYV